ncbi:Probable glutathione S-transferase [Linum grandiflorum]
MEPKDKVMLFKTWSSPFVLRVTWALVLKSIPFESLEEDLHNKSDLLVKYNPVHKKVPLLLHNGRPISESLVILEYIDETWRQNLPRLMPRHPVERAYARFWARFGDDKVGQSIWEAFIKEGKEQEQGLAATAENFKLLDSELKGKKFFGGEDLGIADLSLGWLVSFVPAFDEIMGLKLADQEQYPSLWQWKQRMLHQPVVKDCSPLHHKLVAELRSIRHRCLPHAAASASAS